MTGMVEKTIIIKINATETMMTTAMITNKNTKDGNINITREASIKKVWQLARPFTYLIF
jgi:hypothetical protein